MKPPRGIKRKDKNRVSFSSDTKLTDKNTAPKINFDPNSFSCAVQNILDFMIPDDDSWDLESDSDMSAFGDEPDIELESNESNLMEKYMNEMDKELAKTTIGDSFHKKSGRLEGFDDVEEFKPVDIDMNALKNVLESYQAQLGEAGPASNMLGPMGVCLKPEGNN